MISRERVLAVFSKNNSPDRMPVDFGRHGRSGISVRDYKKLRELIGLPQRPARIFDPINGFVMPDDDFLDWFCIDTIDLGSGFVTEDELWTDWRSPDGLACNVPLWFAPKREKGAWAVFSKRNDIVGRAPFGSDKFEPDAWPMSEKDDPIDVADYLHDTLAFVAPPPPGPLAMGRHGDRTLRDVSKKAASRTDRAIIASFEYGFVEAGQRLYGPEVFARFWRERPERIEYLFDHLSSFMLERLDRLVTLTKPHVDIVACYDNLRPDNLNDMTSDEFATRLQDRYSVLWRRAREIADVKILFHCRCDSPELLAAVNKTCPDAIGPIKGTSAAAADGGDWDLESVPEDVVFWGGGLDLSVLNGCKPVEIRTLARNRIAAIKNRGNSVFRQTFGELTEEASANINVLFETLLDNQ